MPPDLVGEPEVVVTLSRDEVDRALEDRRALDRPLAPSPGVFSGERLLKVQKLHEGDFHTRLGLEEGDVLMIVNGELVTFGSGSIWDAFASGESVTMLVMRRGRPHVYEYRIR